jgi:hypothetical protein
MGVGPIRQPGHERGAPLRTARRLPGHVLSHAPSHAMPVRRWATRAALFAIWLARGALAEEPANTAAPWGPSAELEPEHGVFAGSVPDPYRLALRRALVPTTAYGSCQLLTLPALGSERSCSSTAPTTAAPPS